MKVVVLGGDGFCGWPTSLNLSFSGHEVLIIDNLVRRKIDIDLEVQSLTPISSLEERIYQWNKITKKKIKFLNIDLSLNVHRLFTALNDYKPDVIIHFAEQRSAPYSMKSSFHKRYTVNNNINVTHNLLSILVELKRPIHLIHLGTMGVYGYSAENFSIPEGYLKVYLEDKKTSKEILHPTDPGSVYHMTKTLDQLMFYYYNKNDNLRITDLHQGIVWGIQTNETNLHPKLVNRFDYDGDFGTVLNRFLVQAAIGYPLTVHGSGKQTRAFINIQNTVECIKIAIDNPPSNDDKVKIYNQMTETHTVIDLASLVSKITNTPIDFIDNPRNEKNENELCVENKTMIDDGLSPILLKNEILREVIKIAEVYKNRINKSKIPCKSFWTDDIRARQKN